MENMDIRTIIEDEDYEEVGDLLNAIADVIESAIDGMPSIPTKLEEFLSVLKEQPVPVEKAEAIKACFRKIFGDDDEEIADMDFATVDDIPEGFVGFFLYEQTTFHPRLVKSDINWSLHDILELV